MQFYLSHVFKTKSSCLYMICFFLRCKVEMLLSKFTLAKQLPSWFLPCAVGIVLIKQMYWKSKGIVLISIGMCLLFFLILCLQFACDLRSSGIFLTFPFLVYYMGWPESSGLLWVSIEHFLDNKCQYVQQETQAQEKVEVCFLDLHSWAMAPFATF